MRRLPVFARRLLSAVFVYALCVAALAAAHDYPQFLSQLKAFRQSDSVAGRRPWLNTFYFLNEAGSGIKFFITGNERHFAHYPSPSHLLSARLARAAGGDWQAQMLVGKMYFFGEYVGQDRREGLLWMREAGKNAPPQYAAQMAQTIKKAEAFAAAQAQAAEAKAD